MKLQTTFIFDAVRRRYRVRIIGWISDGHDGARKLDTRENVPEELFVLQYVDPHEKTPRGDVIAAGYAASRARELNAKGAWQPRRMNLEEIGKLWIERRTGQVDPKTIDREQNYITHLVSFFDDEQRVAPDAIDVGWMERYREKRLQDDWIPRLGTKAIRKISPRTVANELSFARKFLTFGYERERETGMRRLKLTSVPHVRGKRRTRGRKMAIEEFWLAYEAAARLPRDRGKARRILAFGLTTWLRKNPLVHLRREWLNVYDRSVTVPPEFMKGRLDDRKELTLPLTRWAMAALEPLPDKGYIWPVNRATGRPATNLFHTLAAIAKRAGIPPFSLHDLRRTGNTILLNHRCENHPQGVPKIVADRILAHAQPISDEAYTEIAVETMREALSVFDELWDAYNRRPLAGVVDIASRRD